MSNDRVRFFTMEDDEIIKEAREWKFNNPQDQPVGFLVGELAKRLEAQLHINSALKDSNLGSRYAVDALEDQVSRIKDLLSKAGVDVSHIAGRTR